MAEYEIRIFLTELVDPVIIKLPGVSRDAAENFTAQLRFDVEHARAIDAPLVSELLAGHEEIDVDPRHVRSIDLEEA